MAALVTPLLIAQHQTAAATDAVYTSPAGKKTWLKDVQISNAGATTQTATMYVAPPATPPTDLHMVFKGIPVQKHMHWQGSVLIEPSWVLHFASDGPGLAWLASGGQQ